MAVGRFFLVFVDGGWVAPSAIAVAGFQMENFLLFDEAGPRLQAWFSGTLLFIRTTCGNLTSPQGYCPGDLCLAAVAGERAGELCPVAADVRASSARPQRTRARASFARPPSQATARESSARPPRASFALAIGGSRRGWPAVAHPLDGDERKIKIEYNDMWDSLIVSQGQNKQFLYPIPHVRHHVLAVET
jgi:hypothetical protein